MNNLVLFVVVISFVVIIAMFIKMKGVGE